MESTNIKTTILIVCVNNQENSKVKKTKNMRTLSIFDAGGKNSTKNDKHNSWDL